MRINEIARPASHFAAADIDVVPVNFAKQLELELEEALKTIKQKDEVIKMLKEQYDAATIMLSDFDPQSLL